MCSNGCTVTEVIQFTRKFGMYEDGHTEDPSKIKLCLYVEAVKMNGDPDVPAGKASIISFLYEQVTLFVPCKAPCIHLLQKFVTRHIIFPQYLLYLVLCIFFLTFYQHINSDYFLSAMLYLI